jgi:hypothetical protein
VKGQPLENKRLGSFSGAVGGGGCQGKVIPPKNECNGLFLGVVGAGGRLTKLLELK